MITETNLPEVEQPLFAEEDFFQYEHASNGQRFLNFIIDNLLMNYGLSWLTGYVIGFFLVRLSPEFYVKMVLTKGVEFWTVIYLICIFNYVIYYSFCEKVFNGYTLGKLITGTKAIREDGSPLTWKNAFLRSLSRLVPFEAFSAWSGDGMWHDSWTRTVVIKSR